MPVPGADVKISVRVYPSAATSGVVGFTEGVLRVRVSAPPVKGKANKELIALLSKILDISRNKICIIRGHVNRNKVISIDGLNQDEVMKRLIRD